MVIKQSEINIPLLNKLHEADIKLSSELCKRGAIRNNLTLDIICRNNCNCSEKDNMFFTLPEGNVSTDIMFIGGVPSNADGRTHTTMFDADGRLLTVVLDKLGLKRDNVYVTNVCKCYVDCSKISCDQLEDITIGCASNYLLREIDMIKPKVIVTLGLDAANTVRQLIMGNEPVKDVSQIRGQVFNTQFNDSNFKVVHTYSPSFILSKNGSLYDKYKLDLWNDVRGAFARRVQ